MSKNDNLLKAVYIEWEDSTMRNQIWNDIKTVLSDTSNNTIKTLGYLISEDKLSYGVCTCLYIDDEDVKVGGVWRIPKGCVKKIKIINGY